MGLYEAQGFTQLLKFCSLFDKKFHILSEKGIFKTRFGRRGHRFGGSIDSANLMDSGYLDYLK